MRNSSWGGRALLLQLALYSICTAAKAAAPVAVDDFIVVTDRYRSGERFEVIVDVLANDRDADGDPLRVDPSSITEPVTEGGAVRGMVRSLDDETLVYSSGGYAPDEEFEEVSFEYRLFGSSRQAEVTLSPIQNISEPIGNVDARDDGVTTQPGTQVTIPVLDNDAGLDLVVTSVGTPQKGSAVIDGSETNIIYTPDSSFTSGQDQFTYTAALVADPGTDDTATVTVTVEDDTQGGLSTLIFDDFDSMLDGEELEGREPTISDPGVTWTGRRIAPLAKGALQIDGVFESVITNPDPLDARVRPFLPFEPQNFEGEDYELEADVKVGGHGWVALNFSHETNKGIGDCVTTDDPDEDQDLWGFLQPSGKFVLRTGCVARGVVLAQVEADDSETPFEVSTTGLNNIVIRVEESCPDGNGHACVSARINGTWVIDRVAYENSQQATSPTSSITNAGLIINLGSEPAAANTVAFDNVSVRVGDVKEPRLSVEYKPDDGLLTPPEPIEDGDLIVRDPIWETQEDTLDIQVKNEGSANLLVSDISLAGSNAWTIERTDSVVEPGGVGIIRLKLSGADPGTFSNTLSFDTNDERFPEFSVNVEGTVQDIGLPPIANDDSYVFRTEFDTSLLINTRSCTGSSPGLLCNDSWNGFEEELELGLSPLPTVSHGTLVFLPHVPIQFEYTPDPGYRGSDSFVYEAVDPVGRSDFALATIIVDGPPSASFGVNCDEAICSFDASSSSDLEDGQTLQSYSWDFGDANVGTGPDPVHVYAASGTYPVTLTVTDSQGQTDSVSGDAVVDLKPDAAFSVSCLDRECSFDATASMDDNGVDAYQWQFGDGRSGFGVTTEHTYANSGTFDVNLTVTDTIGQTDTQSQSILVDVRPKARFSVDCTSLTCTFDGGGSSDDFGIVQYAWDFGDGTGGAFGQSVTHQFPEEGTYTVILSVADTIGQTGSSDRPVTVFDEESFLLLLILESRR